MNNNCDRALGFWTVGIQYLHLVQTVAAETAKQGNSWIVISDAPNSTEKYDEKTTWSDHNLIIPLLFNFYHGLEVVLKGFLTAKGVSFRNSHKLSELLQDFNNHIPSNSLSVIFDKYINQQNLPSILKKYCAKSGISIDDYYQSLKYPESTRGNVFQHYPLKYKGEDGVQFFNDLINDIEIVRKDSVALGRNICPNA